MYSLTFFVTLLSLVMTVMCSKIEPVLYMLIFLLFVFAFLSKCYIFVFISNAKCACLLLGKVTCSQFLIEPTEMLFAPVESMYPLYPLYTLFHALSNRVTHSIRVCRTPVLFIRSLAICTSEFHALMLVHFSPFLRKHVFPMSAIATQVHTCPQDKYYTVSFTAMYLGQWQYVMFSIPAHFVTFLNENTVENRMICIEFYPNEYE